MKPSVILIVLAFFSSISLAQEQINNQPQQPQDPPQGWYMQNNGSTPVIPRLSFINKDTGWCGSLYTSDGGNHWTRYQNGRFVLQFVDSLNGWSSSPKGNDWISHTMDGGNTWLDYHPLIGIGSNLFFCTPNRGFCISDQYIASTVDSGKTWKKDTTNVGIIDGFAGWDSLHLICSGHNYVNPDPPHNFGIASIFRTSDGGQTWKFATQERLSTSIFQPSIILDTTTIYFIGGPNGLYKSVNQGYTFQPLSLSFGAWGGAASDKYNITFVGNGGDVYRTYNAGKNWIKQNSGVSVRLYCVTFVDSSSGWAAGENETIIHTTNAGYTWVKQSIFIDTLNLQTHPNPANSILNVGFTLPSPDHVSISILDLTGHEILAPLNNMMEPLGVQFLPIDIHTLSSGVYMLHIQTAKYQSAVKFTVVR